MICPSCNNGFIVPSIAPTPLVLSYRSFSKVVGNQILHECSNCLYESIEENKNSIDIDQEWVIFKREVNKQLSVGEEL